jgi:hypothetical protein
MIQTGASRLATNVAQHALRQTIGFHASNELIPLLGRLVDELKAREAHAKSSLDKAAVEITKTAVTHNDVITPAVLTVALAARPMPSPPVVSAEAPAPPVVAQAVAAASTPARSI